MSIEKNLVQRDQADDQSGQSSQLLREHQRKVIWSSESDAVLGTIRQLGLHGKDYFSPLRASFLFEYKSLQAVAYFSPILVRDGVMTLLNFFYRNPMPAKGIKLILNPRMRSLVPAEWLDHCVFYQYRSTENKSGSERKNLLLIVSGLGQYHLDQKQLKSVTKKILSDKNASQMNMFYLVCPSESQDSLEMNNFQATKMLQQIFTLNDLIKSKAQPISFKELSELNMSSWCFADLNPLKMYYSDSYVRFHLSSLGAQDLLADSETLCVETTIPINFYESIEVGPCSNQSLEKLTATVARQLAEFRANKFIERQEMSFEPKAITEPKKICTPSFEKLSFRLAQQICHGD